MIMKVKYKRLTIRQLIHNWINRKMGIEEIRYHISECSLEMSGINWRSSYDWNTGIYYCIYHCHLSRGNLNIYFDALVRCNATYAFNGGGRDIEYTPTEYGVAEVNFIDNNKENTWSIPMIPKLQEQVKFLMNNTKNPPKIS